MRKAPGILHRKFNTERLVRVATSYRPGYLLSFLLFLVPHSMLAQSKAEWDQYKIKCGIPASTAYNDWVAQGSHCNTGNAATTTPAVPALTSQQQLAMQGAALGGYMIGQSLHQLLFGPKPTQPAAVQPNPAEEQRKLAAQQLNNSGLYLLKQKNYAGAINEFQKALAIIPNDPSTLHNLALAKQQLKDAAVAGQTSGALGQFLGNAPANTGIFGFGQLTDSTAANANASASSLVNLDSDAKVLDLRGMTKTSVDPEMLKGQLDRLFASTSPSSAAPDAKAAPPEAHDIEQLFQPPPSGSATQPENQNQSMDAEQTTKAIDQAIGQNQSADAQQPLAHGARGNTWGPVSTNPATEQLNSHLPGSAANPDFDGRTTGNAPLTGFDLPRPQPSSDAVDLSGTTRTTVDPARVNGAPASIVGSGGAMTPPAVMHPVGLNVFSAWGAPIFDCQGDRALVTRLSAGLPGQDDAIRRTSAAIEAAKSDSASARRKARLAAFKTLNSAAISTSELSKAALAKVEALRSNGITIDAAARFRLLQQIKSLAEDANELATATEVKEKAIKSFEAGEAFGNTMLVQEAAKRTLDKIAAIEKLLVDSGIQDDALEEIAAHLALYGLGPIGGPIGNALVHTIASGTEFVTQAAQDWNSIGEAETAERNLGVMRDQQRLVRDRIFELQQDLAQGCSDAKAENK